MFKQFIINDESNPDIKYNCTGKIIGSGSFSHVCLGYKLNTNEKVAIKIIKPHYVNNKSQKYSEQLKRELNIIEKLNHQNIVKSFYISQYFNTWCLVMEYCNGGTLESYIRSKNGYLSEYISQHLIKQLCNGLEYLHKFDIIHRDLKPDNLLIHYQDYYDPIRNKKRKKIILKIIDFGLATTENIAQTQCGSKMYMAPEIFLCKKYTYKADLWSVGVILYRMLTGQPLFNKMPKNFNIFKPESKLYNPQIINGKYSDNCIDLLNRTLVNDPDKRIDWHTFVNHPFFTIRIMTDPDYKLELTTKELQQLKSITNHDSLYMDSSIINLFNNNIDINEPLTKNVCNDYRLVLSVLKIGDKRLASAKFDEAKIIYKESLDVLRNIIKNATSIIDKKPRLKTSLLRKVYKDIFSTCTIYVDRIKSINVNIFDSHVKIISIIMKYVNFCCKKIEIMSLFDDNSHKINKKIQMSINCLDFLDKFIDKRNESDMLRKILLSKNKKK